MRSVVNSLVIAELVDRCNLRCALCWNRDRVMTSRTMSLSTIEKIVERYREQKIAWYNWGDPLLYPQFEAFSKIVQGTESYISTNLSLFLEDSTLEALNRFHTIIVSLSGMSQVVYQKYNCGGDIKTVLDNLLRIANKKSTTVKIRWQQHPENKEEKLQCEELCKDLDLVFEPITLTCCVEDILTGFCHRFLGKRKSTQPSCKSLREIAINTQGEYLLCDHTQNVGLDLFLNDDVVDEEIYQAKLKHSLCKRCRKHNAWKTYF